MSDRDELKRVAKRMVWFKPPEEALKETKLFLAHLMTYGTLSDLAIAMKYYSEKDFEEALHDPPPGIFDIRSWNYWNLRFGYDPVPPLPSRTFPSDADHLRS